MRGMCITPYRAYLKKDETIGSNFQEFNRRSSWGRKNLTVQDAAILGKLDFFADGTFQPSYDWPDGEELTGLVREIVETGRARAHEIRGMTLSWSPPRRVDLAWEVGTGGEQSIVARDGAGSTMTLLPFPSPFFLDPATGETGVAETSLSPRMASWFASAPPVPHESVGAVAAKLSRVGQHAPVPRLQRVEERTDVRPEPVLTLYGCGENVILYAPGEYRRGPGKDVSAVFPCARLEIVYEGAGRRLRPGEIGGLQADGDGRPAVIQRDPVREAGFREALVQAAKRHGGKDPSALRYEIRPPPGVLDADFVFPPLRDEDEGDAAAAGIGFVSRMVPALRAEGWRVEIDKTWPFRIYEGPVAFSTALESADADWFSLALSLEANGQTFDISPIVLQIVDALPVNEWGQLEDGFDVDRHLAGRVVHARFEDGAYLAIDGARFARFAEAFLEAQGLLGFHRAEAGRLFELAEALEGCGAPWTGGRELLDLGARLRSLSEAPELPAPAALRGELRPYQRAGYGWLRALSDSGFGGMLADDMGLGKTVQALALRLHLRLRRQLAARRDRRGGSRRRPGHGVSSLRGRGQALSAGGRRRSVRFHGLSGGGRRFGARATPGHGPLVRRTVRPDRLGRGAGAVRHGEHGAPAARSTGQPQDWITATETLTAIVSNGRGVDGGVFGVGPGIPIRSMMDMTALVASDYGINPVTM